MVTARDGSFSTVTKKPLRAPRTAPSTMQSGMIVSIGRPASHSEPITADVNPSVLATDRSISPVTMMNVIGSATRAIGSRSSSRKVKLRLVPKFSTAPEATISTITVTSTTAASQLSSREYRFPRSDMGVPLLQCLGDPDRDQPVGADGQQDERADDRLLPELVDVEHGQGAADDRQQERAEARAPDRAAAAEHGDPADDGRGDHVQLVAGAGGRVDRAEAGGEQDTGEPGERAADQERGGGVAADLDARQLRRLRARPHRVQLA